MQQLSNGKSGRAEGAESSRPHSGLLEKARGGVGNSQPTPDFRRDRATHMYTIRPWSAYPRTLCYQKDILLSDQSIRDVIQIQKFNIYTLIGIIADYIAAAN